MAAIELDGVRKQFGGVTALEGVDLTVEEGEIYGFLGPNGAGKSTTINVLLDFVRPTNGTARVLGHDVREESTAIRERTGVLPEGYDVYDRLTGREHLEFVIDSKDAYVDPAELLDRVGLDEEDAQRKAGGYSKGMAQRLVLAMALVGEPDLLILDEPSSGLDPNGARMMREIVREENERGATVFFSSHILGQVESVCDRVGIIQDGTLVAEDSIENLQEATDVETTLTVSVDQRTDAVVSAVRDVPGVTAVDETGSELVVTCSDDIKMDVLTAIEEAGVEVEDFDTHEPSLEELFAAYTDGTDQPQSRAATAGAEGDA
ncbi:ABC-2 type transport system ATP-binding protein [Halomicrobium zhouii]|uniref:ABC-2 type transport system ATP-binding protein n=1 Tax=Halomicrobium zhouii TaxID=767519 RepID=A0A1I6KCG7_9EURY|nr:ABC transporter ATP-binding protein [Halomicrobium zhouii]SFR88985.1 ABC-2 type transport system ATP-binding protein [Halomicrobium zhouii]